MFTHDSRRRLVRLLLVPSLVTGLVLGALASPASADTPLHWDQAPEASPLGYLLLLLIIPLGAAIVIALLAVLPSLARRKDGIEPGEAWRGETEWFGGPTKGVDAAAEVSPEKLEKSSADAGGSSGRW